MRTAGRFPDPRRARTSAGISRPVAGLPPHSTVVRDFMSASMPPRTPQNSEMRRGVVFPLPRGSGPRVFPEGGAPDKLSLAVCESYETGVVYLAYRPQA